MKPIFIIGYMCSGKTTFGKALALETGMTFIDLDEYIEKKTGKTISGIFREQGEEFFRKLERESLIEVAEKGGNVIISCGGGTPCFFDNIEIMKRLGETVFLEASEQTLLKRLILYQEQRPIVAGRSAEEIRELIKTQLEVRLPFYLQAGIHWNSDALDSLSEIKESIDKFRNTHFSLFPAL